MDIERYAGWTRARAEAAERAAREREAKASALLPILVRRLVDGYGATRVVLVGSLAAMGKYLIPGTPLAGERSPDEVRKVAATLK